MNQLIDTDILVDYLRDVPAAVSFFENPTIQLHVSAMSVAELCAGAREADRPALQQFLLAFRHLPVDVRIARLGGEFRARYGASHGTGLIDALLAATALTHGLTLATGNLRHYPMLENAVTPYPRDN